MNPACVGCGGPLGDDGFERCNLSSTTAFHKRCCPSCRIPSGVRHVDDFVHGTVNGYSNYRCRCAACVDASRIGARAQRRDDNRQRVSA